LIIRNDQMSEVRKETKDPLTKAQNKWDRLSSERITSVCEYLTSEEQEQELQGVQCVSKVWQKQALGKMYKTIETDYLYDKKLFQQQHMLESMFNPADFC
jgi:hypothetical protein